MRPSIERRELIARIDSILDTLRAVGANVAVTSGEEAVEAAAEPFEARGIIVIENGRFRVRERNVLRYYARSIQHLLVPATASDALMIDAASKAFFHSLAQVRVLQRLASRYGMASKRVCAALHRRRIDRGGDRPPYGPLPIAACC